MLFWECQAECLQQLNPSRDDWGSVQFCLASKDVSDGSLELWCEVGEGRTR